MEAVLAGVASSFFAGLGTGLGALPVFLPLQFTQRLQGILLGVGGGVMLAATAFSLIVPGTEAAIALGYSQITAALIIALGILLGSGFLWFAHGHFPHEHFFKEQEDPVLQNLQRM